MKTWTEAGFENEETLTTERGEVTWALGWAGSGTQRNLHERGRICPSFPFLYPLTSPRHGATDKMARVASWLNIRNDKKDLLFCEVSLPIGLENRFPETSQHHHPQQTSLHNSLARIMSHDHSRGGHWQRYVTGKALRQSGSLRNWGGIGTPEVS